MAHIKVCQAKRNSNLIYPYPFYFRNTRYMWRDDHIRQIPQRRFWWQRFVFNGVQTGTADPLLSMVELKLTYSVYLTYILQYYDSIREKGRDLTQSYDKSPYNIRKIQKATWQHKNATKTSITQRLRTDLGRSVWGNDSHRTVVVKPVYWIQTFPLTTKAVKSKGHTFKNL